MIDYLKQNHLSIFIIIVLGLSSVMSSAFGIGASPAANLTRITNPFEFQNTVQINGNVTLSTADFTSTGGDTSLATTSVSTFTQGGSVYATTTTAAAHTFTEAELLSHSVLRFTGSATAAAITATLPATSTMTTLLPTAGDSRTWFIENGYTAAATTTTIAAGTGIDLQEPDGQNVVIGINNYAKLTCFRETSTDVVCMVDETIPAD